MYFREAKELCDRDNGRLWGVSLCGPMVFADARTRTIATSQPAPPGEQPRSIGFANAPIEWAGTRWAAYIWPFIPDDRRGRDELLMHELFHRIQPQLGLIAQTVPNAHLDTLEGRYWLQLEWRALAQALRSSGDIRARAMRDALAFEELAARSFWTLRRMNAAVRSRKASRSIQVLSSRQPRPLRRSKAPSTSSALQRNKSLS
jgi:hypothetical protein